MKTCTKCGVEQPLDCYYAEQHKNGRTYLRGACKGCSVKKNAAWRASKGPEYRKEEYQRRDAKHRARDRQSVRDHYRRQRESVLALLGGRCRGCGCDDQRLLQVDHVNNDGAQERREVGDYRAIYRKILAAQDTVNYQALCANCHVLKTYHGEVF